MPPCEALFFFYALIILSIGHTPHWRSIYSTRSDGKNRFSKVFCRENLLDISNYDKGIYFIQTDLKSNHVKIIKF